MESLLTSPVGDVDSPDRKLSQRCTGLSAARKRHFCGSVITHYDTFILRLQSIVGSPRGYAASAEASAGFAVCSVCTNRKNRRGQQLICRQLLRIIFCPHPSQPLRIIRWGRRPRKVVLSAFLRAGRNDCDSCFSGIIFTVATFAAVAQLIHLQLRKSV